MSHDDEEQDGSHPHAYEHLLIGWVMGGLWQWWREKREERKTVPQHLPPTAASTCLQGGTGANGHITTLQQQGL